jgi:tetratricopeptide (TPR) repeat protein
MWLWPFRRSKELLLSPIEVRDLLISTAGSGSSARLKSECRKFATVVTENLDLMTKVPEAIRSHPENMGPYVQCLAAVAECLAQECGVPHLWDKLCGTTENNPLKRLEAWYVDLPARKSQLEHTSLIGEAQQFITEMKSLEGPGARHHEAVLHGHLGMLLFGCGKVEASVPVFKTAIDLCGANQDFEGQLIHSRNRVEAHRYLGNIDDGIRAGEVAINLAEEHGFEADDLRRQLHLMRRGEPLCRVIIVCDEKEFEVDEFKQLGQGTVGIHFRRNRLSIPVAEELVRQGNELAAKGQLADALERYQAARELDPYDPDPDYQSGVCLMDLGAFSQAKQRFEEVERLAPGWFRCRFDHWLAQAIEDGRASEDEYRLLRLLDDGGLSAGQAKSVVQNAIEMHPHFAPFRLILGDLFRKEEENEKALDSYRTGLALVTEPDLESRLLCATAAVLPNTSLERQQFIERAQSIPGSLVAKAMATLIGQLK